jgi:hypothetical protein
LPRDTTATRKLVAADRLADRVADQLLIMPGLAAAIPLPQGIAPPVTEVPLSGLTKFLISRENELALRVSPRGGPSEARAGNQRDQRESGDKRFHDASP